MTHGGRTDAATGSQPGTVTEDIDALATHLKLDKFHLVGIAGGGFVALDYAADRIRANVIAPGAIETPFLHRSFARQADPEAARQRSLDRHPLGRFGTVEEVARAALFLASDESSFTTGSVLMVEGGWNAA